MARFKVITLRNLTPPISMLPIILLVLLLKNACAINNGIAAIKPNAVVFIATEIDSDNNFAFSEGSALATAVKAAIKPIMVPSSPNSVATLASTAK